MAAENEEWELVADDEGTIPTGFRFKPTDKELVEFYLLHRLQGRPTVPNDAIIEANVYEFNPETLIYEYRDRGKNAWYFLSPRARIYQNGARPARKTEDGYGRWKSSSGTKVAGVTVSDGIKFCKTVLNYFVGTPKKEKRTTWLMRELTIPEYAIKSGSNGGNSATLDEYVMCKIYVSPVHRKVNDEASTSSACQAEEAQHSQLTAESELHGRKAGKRPLQVQSRKCATARKQARQRSLTIRHAQTSGASNAPLPAQPTRYTGQTSVQRPPIPMQFPPNVPTAYPNSYGQMTAMVRPANLGFPAPGTGFRPQVSLQCYYDHNYRAVQPPGANAAYGMPPQPRPLALAPPPPPPQHPYLNRNPNDHAGASAFLWPPYNSNPYEGSSMAHVAVDGATTPNAGSGLRSGNVSTEYQLVDLASINTFLAGDRPITAEAPRTELATPIRAPQVETEMEEASSLHKQDTTA